MSTLKPSDAARLGKPSDAARPGQPSDTARLLGALAAVAAVALVLGEWLRVSNASIVSTTYLLIVLLVAATSRLRVAVATSLASVLCLNFFFLPPIRTLTIEDPQNWFALFAFLAVSLIASNLSAVARARTEEAVALLEERKAGELTRQSEQLKTALLASISHDLRTPLTAIRVAASNLKASDFSRDDSLEQSDLILTEVERLNRLFAGLLEMARIDAGGIARDSRWTHPSEIIAAARDQVERALAGHRVTVAIEPDVPVRLDPRLTATALAHLLENAAQYSPPGSSVDVRARVGGDGLVVEVRDHGSGIAPADLPHLFQRFYRGDAAKARTSGTGMGLWIVRGLLAVEGGRVWAENAEDGGAQFTIAVPAAVQQLQAAESSA